MRGRTNNKSSNSKGRYRSKYKSNNIKCFECHGIRHFRKNCSKQKDKGKKEETSGAANIASEKKKFYDVESILVVSEKNLVMSGFFIRVLYFIFILI